MARGLALLALLACRAPPVIEPVPVGRTTVVGSVPGLRLQGVVVHTLPRSRFPDDLERVVQAYEAVRGESLRPPPPGDLRVFHQWSLQTLQPYVALQRQLLEVLDEGVGAILARSSPRSPDRVLALWLAGRGWQTLYEALDDLAFSAQVPAAARELFMEGLRAGMRPVAQRITEAFNACATVDLEGLDDAREDCRQLARAYGRIAFPRDAPLEAR